jgi:uncharacterized RDD family membrane protein YckC
MSDETKIGAPSPTGGWDGVERRKPQAEAEPPEESFTPVPTDWMHRASAFLIDAGIYVLLYYGSGAVGLHLFGYLVAVLYATFRDGLFHGQSLGKKIMGVRVVHLDGRPISFVDSSFRNVLFIIPLLIPLAVAVEAVAAFRNPERRRLGDRIAKTCVIQKAVVPVLA